MTTATFSNGFIDTYKGKRDVKAAWAIINKETGETVSSGHSLDRARAAKTANGNLRYVRLDQSGTTVYYPSTISQFTIEDARKALSSLREVGAEVTLPATRSSVYSDAVKHNENIRAKRRAKTEALCKIEIVDL